MGNTFTPGDAEVGLNLRVIVTFNDRFGVPEQVVGDPFGPIANVNDAPVNLPVILEAEAVADSLLSVDVSQITDGDGVGTQSIQWQRSTNGGASFTNITNATNQTFTPPLTFVNSLLRVRVHYTDLHGTLETVFSAAKTVQGPEIAVSGVSPTSLAWGIRNRNTSAITKTVEVTNSGSAPLLVTNRTRTGTNAASWSQPTGCVEPVLPEESCLVSISFLTGATAGTKTATLNIFTNGGNKTVGLDRHAGDEHAASRRPDHQRHDTAGEPAAHREHRGHHRCRRPHDGDVQLQVAAEPTEWGDSV